MIREIGAIARPRRVVIVPDMPKTRSGKIMRRVLAAISNNEDAGDISTLANPGNRRSDPADEKLIRHRLSAHEPVRVAAGALIHLALN